MQRTEHLQQTRRCASLKPVRGQLLCHILLFFFLHVTWLCTTRVFCGGSVASARRRASSADVAGVTRKKPPGVGRNAMDAQAKDPFQSRKPREASASKPRELGFLTSWRFLGLSSTPNRLRRRADEKETGFLASSRRQDLLRASTLQV